MRHVQLLGVRFHIGHEFLQVVGRKILSGHDEVVGLDDRTYRFEIGLRFVGEVGIERDREGMGSDVTHEDGVAVGISAHCPGGAGGAAGSHDVLHHEGLSDYAAHRPSDNARIGIGRPARSERNDHRDRFCRIGLCPS
jgi:hypothetical protein